jgi:hypothetical protein
MSIYQRNGRVNPNETEAAGAPEVRPAQDPRGKRVNGMQQVIDLLRAADPAFRESLLRRMAAHDPELVKKLRTQV